MAALKEYLTAAVAFSDISRAMLGDAAASHGGVELKPDRTFVTATDRAIEEKLRERISDHFPQHGIWGEEFGRHQTEAEWQWIIDPIDGTAQFMAGIPVYATLIALALDGAPVIGVMDFPAADLRWIGCIGEPTLCNGNTCRTSGVRELANAMMSTSSPDFYAANERPVLDVLRQATRWRIYGGAAMSYGRLAAGRIDLACDASFQVYDFACFRPIIEGAGGVVTDWDGNKITLASGTHVLAAATPELHGAAMRRFKT